MLRITYAEVDTGQRWTLHGRLAGPWTAELRSLWDSTRRAHPKIADVIVDLRDVTFIDEGGEALLRSMKHEGARFLADGVDTTDLLARLDKRVKGPFRQCLSYMERKGRPANGK